MRKSFSLVELVFVIVIIGALAGLATTWLFETRMDSQVATLKSDVATLLTQVPAEIVAGNIDVDTAAPEGFSTWGEWLMYVGALDKARWKSTENGVVAISYVNNNNNSNQVLCDGEYLYIDLIDGVLHFIPSNINANASNFCKIFRNSYNQNSETKINLKSSNAMQY
ncbi:hypothetical protein CCY99_02545 [Helicobacter sp. 16-1353]|uniref:type II secretion system protein n=1 Tax=Helicobacter sp. 16-1353 TaxID=2004996 RepID=UPI000DCE2A9F|nr:type II secretion system protein [Helicobacter sp. 16-1353]RAX54662.1 hypothetical protein CCY99_02545 [Helicobacter sp. 16-1353]